MKPIYPKVLLVDLHGTTVPTKKPLSRAFANAFARLCNPKDWKKIRKKLVALYMSDMGMPLQEKARRALKIIDGKEHSTKEGERFADNAWKEFLKSELKPYAAIPPFLKRLRKNGWKIFFSTDNPQWVADAIVKKIGLGNYCDGILGSEKGIGSHKVEKHANFVAQKYGIPTGELPKHVAYFGDSLGEMQEAKRLGITGIGRTTSYSAKEMKKAGAQKIVRGGKGKTGQLVTFISLRRVFRHK